MKTALYLLVVIAAFALVQESAAAGLLGGLVKSLDTTLWGVENIAQDTIQSLRDTLQIQEKPTKANIAKDSIQGITDKLRILEKQTKAKGTEVKINIETEVKNTTDKVKQQLQKLKETLKDLLDKVIVGLEDVFRSLTGNWKKLKKETATKVIEIMDKNLNESTSSKMEDIKQGISSDLKVLADATADKVKCDENEKKEFENELYNEMENIADAWYKQAGQ